MNGFRFLATCAVLLATSCLTAQVPEFPRVPPVEPDKAEATFRVQGGFRMELIAAEPLVADPVDLAYDPDGRAYVVEFRGYPKPEMPTDPTERKNVAGEHPDEVRRLTMKLAEFDRQMPPPRWPALMEQPIRIDVPSDAPWRADQEYVYWSN